RRRNSSRAAGRLVIRVSMALRPPAAARAQSHAAIGWFGSSKGRPRDRQTAAAFGPGARKAAPENLLLSILAGTRRPARLRGARPRFQRDRRDIRGCTPAPLLAIRSPPSGRRRLPRAAADERAARRLHAPLPWRPQAAPNLRRHRAQPRQ